jgi:23S rRNA (pseudouridine1915-N3)-methyltransferase
MEVTLLAVGKLRPYYREACDDYAGRLRRYVRFTEIEVREATRAPSVPAQRADEAARLTGRLPAGATLVCLAREGKGLSSADLAQRVDRWLVAAHPLAIVIGGSRGLDPALIAGGEAWSLGPLTLPHELARVVVVEQLYRAFTILRGEPYHKGR